MKTFLHMKIHALSGKEGSQEVMILGALTQD